jgi:hypothetical protein
MCIIATQSWMSQLRATAWDYEAFDISTLRNPVGKY